MAVATHSSATASVSACSLNQDEEDIRPYATLDDVKTMVQHLYGLTVTGLKQLNGYDDQNYHIRVDSTFENLNIEAVCESGYVLKILNSKSSAEEHDHLEAQLAMLDYVAKRGVVCPQHVPTKTGELFTLRDIPDKSRSGTTKHIVRLLKYIEGDLLANAKFTAQLLAEGASYLAKFQLALEGFSDKRLEREDYLWNMKNIHMLQPYVFALVDQWKIDIATDFITRWDTVLPKLSTLPYGPIHSDFNEQNILVKMKDTSDEYEIAGILDFGDSGYGYKVFDIAIYMMYMMTFASSSGTSSSSLDLADVGKSCLTGYLRQQSLSEEEYDVLFDCILARFLQSLVMGAFYYSMHHDEYLLVTQKPGWEALRVLVSKPAFEWIRVWKP